MKILHRMERHADQLIALNQFLNEPKMAGFKYICLVVDGPESVLRELSFASDFNAEDTHKILKACSEQTA